MVKKTSISAVLLIIALSIFLVVPIGAASTDGCDALAGFTNGVNAGGAHTYNEGFDGTYEWQAGDTIYWNLQAGPRAGSTRLRVFVMIYNGSFSLIDRSSTTPGDTLTEQGQYTFATTGTFRIYIFAEDYNSTTHTFSANIHCGAVSSPASSTSAEESQPGDVVLPPDNRINWQFGDSSTIVFEHESGDGVVAYCHVDGAVWAGLYVNQATVDNAGATSQNVPVIEYNENGCQIAFYMLDSGEYQLNIWTWDGKLYEMIADNVNFTDATMRWFE